ncbi:nitrate- and nitrite sensing domain-containing protein [Solwaraspora sp. WMMB335]|uniref:sensor histidine kinase n=1 Tax=Solwaraspora sp. WMMB335 TaxID=3404118 RepID=UPI003B9444A4
MLLDRLRIRGKLALLVMVPLITVAALTVPIVVDRLALANRAAEIVRTVQAGGRVGSLVQDLQQERLLAVGHLLGAVDRSRLVLQEATITDRIADIRADIGGMLGPELAAAVDAVDDLAGLRDEVLTGTADSDQVMASYGALIVRLIDSMRLVDTADVTTAEGRQIVALDAALRLDDAISSGATHMLLVVGTRSAAATARYATSLVAAQDNATRFSRFATTDQLALYELVEEALDQRLGVGFSAQSQSGALDGSSTDPTQALAELTAPVLFPSLESLIALGRFVERKIVIDVSGEVARRQEQVLVTAYGVVAGVGLILLAVIALSLVIARSVARPLARLTSSADRVARIAEAELVRVADDEAETPDPVRLDPVDVSGTDEIGDLARAFERVQSTAARLVERQVSSRRNVAQMFGHVGRRTQNLVGRQLALIDRLEREETEPHRLQHLYRLDHVSSRLRRNAGSLVVLSGATGAAEHMSPLPVSDVIRLALGEIEDYTRVDVAAPTGRALRPSVIADVVLLLAEVMENATVFSPPHTRVSVTATPVDDGLRITVVDRGLGLSPQRLAEENTRLTRRERLDLVPTEVLGLFVVGRLARRHGIDVELSATDGAGVTVTIDLGAELLVAPASELPTQAAPAHPAPRWPTPVQPARLAPVPESPDHTGGLTGLPQRRRAVALASVTDMARDGSDPERDSAAADSAATSTPATSTPAFDTSALARATRTLGAGTPWNAFAPPAPVPPAPAPAPATLAPSPPSATPVATPVPAAKEPGGRTPLRQRVPGAQHPVGTGPAPQVGTGPAAAGDRTGQPAGDPATARALVEEFEAGVRRAQDQVARDAAGTGSIRLTQRVPGASLPDPPPAARNGAHQPWPPDPQAAKNALDEFETGVRQALTEITARHQHRKGTEA